MFMSMLMVRRSTGFAATCHTWLGGVSVRYVTNRRDAAHDPDQLDAARKWISNTGARTIPRDLCEVTFSRSSGPGGQNVNKVSSKATLRVPVSSLLPRIPTLLHPAIRNNRFFAEKTGDIVIQADDSRKQSENVEACFRKLHAILVEAGRECIPGETSLAQSQRVQKLQKAEEAGRRKLKQFQSSKKIARRKGGGED